MRVRWLLTFPAVALAACSAPRPETATLGKLGDIPLRRLSDGFYVELSVGGRKSGRFLIDTGSYRCFATLKGEALLREAGAQIDKHGNFRVVDARLGSLSVGTIEIAPWGVNQNTMDPAADGILGLDFLSRYLVGLDLRRGAMRLWPTAPRSVDASMRWLYGLSGKKQGDEEPAGLSVVPMGFAHGLYTVPVRLDGKVIDLVPDTGAGDTFVSAANAKRVGWTRWTGGHDTRLYSGALRVRHYEIHDFRLGRIHYRGAHEVNVPVKPMDVNFVGRDALVGMALLFDYESGTLVVAANDLRPLGP